MPIDEALNAAPTAQPGRPIRITARTGLVRSRQMINNVRLTHADSDRQNTVCHACGCSSLRMNSPPVLKISAEVASSTIAIGETRDPGCA